MPDNGASVKYSDIDVDQRIRHLLEDAAEVVNDPTLLNVEKCRQLEQITQRAIFWDSQRETVHHLDVLADALSTPAQEQ